MATILNRQVTFATNGTVTAAGLHNLIDQTEIYAGIITTQDQIASVGSSDQLLIADADETSTSAPRRVTVGSMFNDALNNGIYTTGSFTNRVTAGSFVGNLTGNVTGTIVGTTGTIATLNSTTSTITNLSATTSTFLGTITGSTNVINIGSGQIYKDASGNVGIGVANPAVKLDVAGGNIQGKEILLENGAASSPGLGTTPSWYSPASGVAALSTNANERLRIDSSGNVGVGTNSPSYRLHINSGANQPALFESSAVVSVAYFKDAGTSSTPYCGSSGNNFYIGTDGTERLRIDSSGNCSIGTATALSTLHVHGNVTLSNTTTATSAGTGGLSKPATYAGYLTVSINGTSRKIPYYAT